MDIFEAIQIALSKGWSVFRNTLSKIAESMPQLIGGFVLLLIGFFLGRLLKQLIVRVLETLGVPKITEDSGADITLKKIGYKGNGVEFIGDTAKWFVYLIALTAAVEALGLTMISSYFSQVTIFLPRVVFAVLLLIIGFMVADFIGKLVNNVITENVSKVKEKGRMQLAFFSENAIRISIYLVTIILSLNALGFESDALNILFALVALTFCFLLLLGTRDIIPNFVASINLQSKMSVGDKIEISYGDKVYSGKIENIGPLYTTLNDRHDLIEIPNAVLLNSIRKRRPKL